MNHTEQDLVGCLVSLVEAARASGFDRGRGTDDTESRRAEQNSFESVLKIINHMLTPANEEQLRASLLETSRCLAFVTLLSRMHHHDRDTTAHIEGILDRAKEALGKLQPSDPYKNTTMFGRRWTCSVSPFHMGMVQSPYCRDDAWVLEKATQLHKSWHPSCAGNVVLAPVGSPSVTPKYI